LGAVEMYPARVVHHETPRRHRNRAVGIEFRAGADPRRSLEHGDEAVVGMEVRPAEMIARGPLDHNRIESRFRRFAGQHCGLNPGGWHKPPLAFYLTGPRGCPSGGIEITRARKPASQDPYRGRQRDPGECLATHYALLLHRYFHIGV